MASPYCDHGTAFLDGSEACTARPVFHTEGSNDCAVAIDCGDHSIRFHGFTEKQLLKLADDMYDAARQIADRAAPPVTTAS